MKFLFALAALSVTLTAPTLANETVSAAVPAPPALINGILTPFDPVVGTPCFGCVVPAGSTTKNVRTLGMGLPVYTIPLSLTSVGVLSFYEPNVTGKCAIKISAVFAGKTIPVLTSPTFSVSAGRQAFYHIVIPRPAYHGILATFETQYFCGSFKSNISSQQIYLV
jgi:hypothetical protein